LARIKLSSFKTFEPSKNIKSILNIPTVFENLQNFFSELNDMHFIDLKGFSRTVEIKDQYKSLTVESPKNKILFFILLSFRMLFGGTHRLRFQKHGLLQG